MFTWYDFRIVINAVKRSGGLVKVWTKVLCRGKDHTTKFGLVAYTMQITEVTWLR